MQESNSSTDDLAPEAENSVPLQDGEDQKTADTATAEKEAPQESVDPIIALQDDLAKWKDLALRSRADLDNYRKRMAAEKSESIRYANQSLFESLLPVLDNFHFGIDAARSATEPSGVLLGMEMVLKQFQDFLEAQNISAIPSDPGVDFDPNLHEAVAQEFDNKVAEGLIIKTVRSGYRMGERLIRASNVVVSKGSQTSAEA
jgi:molecular chaperone GrpE